MPPSSTTIFVTGGNRGIGFGIVQALGARIPSATVLIGCRSLAAGQDAIQALRSLGPDSQLDLVQIDIDDDVSIAAAVETVARKYGRLDVLINNAAGFGFPKNRELSELRRNSNQVFNNCITSNLIVTTAFLPLLRKSSFPRVIMNSSARGSLELTASKKLPPVELVDYCVSKAGLNMLTLHLQQQEDVKQQERDRVTFWLVSPGHTKTAFNNFKGRKDPVESAEAFVRLVESERGAISPGTFWEHEEGQFRMVPW